ncbi:MAG: plastocyanin/azurin family copper-binding protein [Tepidiformaceae bacterium]
MDITVFFFRPQVLKVAIGTQVTWTNKDDILHTVTSGAPEAPDQVFDGVLNGPGKTFSFTFDKPGMYTYFCSRHNGMRGEVDVS